MNIVTKIRSSLLLVIAVQFAYGQKTTWSLQDCISIGIENNIGIKVQKLEVKRTQKARVSMLNELLPTVNLFGSQSYNFGSTIDPGTNARVSSNIQYDNFYMNAKVKQKKESEYKNLSEKLDRLQYLQTRDSPAEVAQTVRS